MYSMYARAKTIIIEEHENYQKRSYRNRYQILTTHGIDTLSIPLQKGKNNRMKITDVKISYDEPWASKHLNSIRAAYGRSPYFEHYYDKVKMILAARHTFLYDLNTEAFLWLKSLLHPQTNVIKSESYISTYTDTLDMRSVNWEGRASEIKYVQVWQENFNFTPNLSILDLLFCTGPEAASVLKQINIQDTTILKKDANASF